MQPQTLILQLRDGLCVEADRCEWRTAEAGCDCAKIADFIEAQTLEIARLKSSVKSLLRCAEAGCIEWMPAVEKARRELES